MVRGQRQRIFGRIVSHDDAPSQHPCSLRSSLVDEKVPPILFWPSVARNLVFLLTTNFKLRTRGPQNGISQTGPTGPIHCRAPRAPFLRRKGTMVVSKGRCATPCLSCGVAESRHPNTWNCGPLTRASSSLEPCALHHAELQKHASTSDAPPSTCSSRVPTRSTTP